MPPRSHPTVRPKQSLGQNFLIDRNIVAKIVRTLRCTSDDVLVEIGPGTGSLTEALVGLVRHLVIVEIDGRIIGDLKERFSSPDVTILHEDFLETDLPGLAKRFGHPLRIAGNIPYHLTSPILFKLFEHPGVVADTMLMVQREVARRIVAMPGTKDYGILAVFAHVYGVPQLLFNVPPTCFYPRPRVTSTVFRLTLRPDPLQGLDGEVFRAVVRTAFGKRRKTLRNSLRYLPYGTDTLERLQAEGLFTDSRRPEELSPSEFTELARTVAAVHPESGTHCATN